MPGPTPLTALYRVTFKYTVSLFQHKTRMYINVVASGDPSGYNTVPRPAYPAVGVSLLADAFFLPLTPYFGNANSTFDGILLEHRDGTEWVPLWSGGTVRTPGFVGYGIAAMMYTVSGKDQINRAIPAYIYEGKNVGIDKLSSYTALDANAKALVDYFYDTTGALLGAAAYAWRISRGGSYASRWLALVFDTNEKLRRLRHIK